MIAGEAVNAATKAVKIARVVAKVAVLLVKLYGYKEAICRGLRSKQSSMQFENLEAEFLEGPYSKVFIKNRVSMNSHQIMELLSERILSVSRCACSSMKWFPSGLFTPVTLIVAGSAVRDEYLIIHTSHHVLHLIIEVDARDSLPHIFIHAKELPANPAPMREGKTPRQKIEDEFHDKHYYSRVMKKFSGEELLENFKMEHLNKYLNYMIILMREICKSGEGDKATYKTYANEFSRSVLYYSELDGNINTIIQSNLGAYSDKPMYIPPIDSILIEKAVYWSAYGISQSVKDAILSLEDAVKKLRNTEEDPNEADDQSSEDNRLQI